MKTFVSIVFLILTWPALAQTHCDDVGRVKAQAIVKTAGTWTILTSAQAQAARASIAANPEPLPYATESPTGSGAALASFDAADKKGVTRTHWTLWFIDGGKACAPTPVSSEIARTLKNMLQ